MLFGLVLRSLAEIISLDEIRKPAKQYVWVTAITIREKELSLKTNSGSFRLVNFFRTK